MKKQTEYAIRLANEARHESSGFWTETLREFNKRLGREATREVLQYAHDNKVLQLAGTSTDRRWALEVLLRMSRLASWALAGFPLVVLPNIEDAINLANTDPPSWPITSPHGEDPYAVLGVEIGEFFFFVTDWRASEGEQFHENGLRLPLDEEQEKRLIANIGFVLQERPEGLEVREHPPSHKAMRKQGRKHYPCIEYIIQAPRLLHPQGAGVERGPRPEGWTFSLRTYVRGHWRQQAYGPGYSQHKTIWIRPHERGPEDAPVSIHPVKLESARVAAIADGVFTRHAEAFRQLAELTPEALASDQEDLAAWDSTLLDGLEED